MPRVLVGESDAAFAIGLRHTLELDGRAVEIVRDRRHALMGARQIQPHLLILSADLLAPGPPDLLPALRRDRPDIPVLVLGRHPVAAHHVPGFRLGLDEFLLRPLPVRELHARIDGMLARAGAAAGASRLSGAALSFGRIEINPRRREVLRDGRPVELRPREFDLLLVLAHRRGEVVSRLELLRDVWGYSEAVVSRTVDSHVVQLRRKLEPEPTRPAHIITVPTVGYRLDG